MTVGASPSGNDAPAEVENDVSRRTERVGNLIRLILADAIQNRLSDPRILPLTSITRVEVSEDFSVARVFVSVLARPTRRALSLRGLQSAAGLLRRIMAPQLRLRKIPALVFRLDESVQGSAAIVDVIDEAMRDLGQRPAWECEDDAGAAEPASDAGDAAASDRDSRQEDA